MPSQIPSLENAYSLIVEWRISGTSDIGTSLGPLSVRSRQFLKVSLIPKAHRHMFDTTKQQRAHTLDSATIDVVRRISEKLF